VISQQTHLQHYDLGLIADATAVLFLVLAGSQPPLDVDLASLRKQALAVIRELPESDHAVPFGPLLSLAASIREPRLGRTEKFATF
jgi:hypothetical protein